MLASGSQRRTALLKKLGITFIVIKPRIKEKTGQKNIRQELLANALAKAKSISPGQKALIIAGDTVIVYNSRVFGKPKNIGQARRFLRMFSGKTHRVLTGLVVYDTNSGKAEKALVATSVTFRKLASSDIAEHLATGEYKDKAGGYGIQEQGAFLIERINGDYYNVVGLPLVKLVELIRRSVHGSF